MDKSLELKLFRYIYGEPDWWQIIQAESPDFLCMKNGKLVLGAEVTELFTNQSAARLNKIDGYSLDLLNGSAFLHKDDKKNIKVDRVKYMKKGEDDGPDIDAIIQEMPNFAERASLLANIIEAKDGKVAKYLKSCPAVDLIINDASNLFWFNKYEDVIIPLSRLINRQTIINSKFREIFLITTNKDNSTVKIPLKLNFFAQDITVFEKLVFDWKKEKKTAEPTKAMMILLYCLSKYGYGNVSLIAENNCIGLIIGCHLYLYSKDGKNIRDYSTIHEQLPIGDKITESDDELNGFDKEIAKKILTDKQNYNCCMRLFMKVEKV